MTTENKQSSLLKSITTTAAIIVALNTVVGFIGKTWLDDYIDDRVDAKIQTTEERKSSFRSLIAPKIGVDEDEVHIKIRLGLLH